MTALERVQETLAGEELTTVATIDGSACIEVPVARLHALMQRLRNECHFEVSTFVTAVDHHPRTPRFELNYGLLSVRHEDRLRVRAALAEGEQVASVTDLWPGANFSERECFDMFGIEFGGHPDLRRLLMPDGYDHHPLRKDFPHQGIEPDRLYREWDRNR